VTERRRRVIRSQQTKPPPQILRPTERNSSSMLDLYSIFRLTMARLTSISRCMRRLQANLAYLAAIADRSHKPSSQIPPHPAIISAPPLSPLSKSSSKQTSKASPNQNTTTHSAVKSESPSDGSKPLHDTGATNGASNSNDTAPGSDGEEDRAVTLRALYAQLQALFPGVDPKKEPPIQSSAASRSGSQKSQGQNQAQAQPQGQGQANPRTNQVQNAMAAQAMQQQQQQAMQGAQANMAGMGMNAGMSMNMNMNTGMGMGSGMGVGVPMPMGMNPGMGGVMMPQHQQNQGQMMMPQSMGGPGMGNR
jgi:hypothetical protein